MVCEELIALRKSCRLYCTPKGFELQCHLSSLIFGVPQRLYGLASMVDGDAALGTVELVEKFDDVINALVGKGAGENIRETNGPSGGAVRPHHGDPGTAPGSLARGENSGARSLRLDGLLRRRLRWCRRALESCGFTRRLAGRIFKLRFVVVDVVTVGIVVFIFAFRNDGLRLGRLLFFLDLLIGQCF